MRFLTTTSSPGKRGTYFLIRMLAGFVATLTLLSCGGSGDDGAGATHKPMAVAAAAADDLDGTLVLVAGALGGSGNINGASDTARLDNPFGIAVADDGTAYVADTGNHVIRRISTTGEVSVFAGAPGVTGSADGTAAEARFNEPYGIAVTRDGAFVYVADFRNQTLRIIDVATQKVGTLAGVVGLPGSSNGTGHDALFRFPMGLALDDGPTDVLYVAEPLSGTIRKVVVTPESDPATVTDFVGVATTLAGTADQRGTLDGTGPSAQFQSPSSIALNGDGSILYAADTGAHTIRSITTAGGVVETVAGLAGTSGEKDDTGSAARFDLPFGIAVGDGWIYVSDRNNHTIRRISASREVETFAGKADEAGMVNDTGADARFNFPAGLAFAGGRLYVADSSNHVIRRIDAAAEVSTLAGVAPTTGSNDGAGPAARFNQPTGLSLASDGTIYVADSINHTIRKITSTGEVSTLAGLPGSSGIANGTGDQARFNVPIGIAVAANGLVYVADVNNNAIRVVTPAGEVSTLAGTPSPEGGGSSDGTGPDASFLSPVGITVDAAGNIYVADTGNHIIRRITPTGVVTTIAGRRNDPGPTNGPALTARFNNPIGVAVDAEGNLYVADQGNHVIRKIDTTGNVSTLAGRIGFADSVDGSGSGARFNSPSSLTIDTDGNLYVADSGGGLLRQVTPAGSVKTIAGQKGSKGVTLGELPATLSVPTGIALGMDGHIYFTDENAVLKLQLDRPVNVFGLSLGASATSLTLGQSLTLGWAATDAGSCTASGAWTGPRAAFGTLDITPDTVGDHSYELTCTEAGGGRTLSKSVTVQVSHPVPVIAFSASRAVIAPGESATLTWSTQNADSCTAVSGWTDAPGTSGSLAVTPPAGSNSYTLSCTGPGGTLSKTVKVNVGNAPTLTLTASSPAITYGESFTLSWATTNATNCSATDFWNGLKSLDQSGKGSEKIEPIYTGKLKYSLTCSGLAGTVTKFVYVEVKEGEFKGGSGGGGGAGPLGLDMLAGLGLLALLRRAGRGRMPFRN